MTPQDPDTLAVDLALLVPEPAAGRVLALNADLFRARSNGFRLDATHLPHISLVQMFTRRIHLPALEAALDPHLAGRGTMELHAERISASGSTVSLLIEPSPALLSLHTRLMDAASAFEEPAGTETSFYSGAEAGLAPEPPRDRDLAWVSGFRRAASFSRFVPHITLGIGNPPVAQPSLDFAADRAGLFHLGRFCTCRAALHEWRW